MTDIELLRHVYQMRAAQRGFFASQDDDAKRRLLRDCKRLERIVDAELRQRAPDLEPLKQFEGTGETASQ